MFVSGGVFSSSFSSQNDIWQTQSWASVEWSGQWKLLHYFIRRTYDRVLVSPYYLNGKVIVYVVVDVANYDITYELNIKVIGWSSVRLICIFENENFVLMRNSDNYCIYSNSSRGYY